MSGPAIILVEPQLGENIGAAARAMANFGLRELRIVNPRDGWPNPRAQGAAALAASIVDNAKIYSKVGEAVADLHFLAATTARGRFLVKPVLSPEDVIGEIARRELAGERCGILYG